jgi:hydrogenase maturation protein HypF
MEGRRIDIRGTVQGVGFRPWVYRLAHELGLGGRVRNDARGVTIEAFGERAALDTFVERLHREGPPASVILDLSARPIPVEERGGFAIVHSDAAGERRLAIPPDLATCERCVAEIFDPRNRRYRYPFTNCTDCGPRFTIAWGVPYDRPATTMAAFTMCAQCAREYDDPLDRRFHAQPNACPVCGPQLHLIDGDGVAMAAPDPLAAAAAALHLGQIVAVKGLGGYHLAVDATQAEAVARLRERKRREAKPLAVMVRDLSSARALAEIDAAAAQLLTSVERPIVLVPRRAGTIADEVAPGNPLLGIFLPYTPLHHLLLAELAGPLVMTSGNLSDEPIAYRDDEALRRLHGIADLFLVHDREIAGRADDSVAHIVDGRPMVLRRARGWVPGPFPVAGRFAKPILALGGDLKNVACLAVGDAAWLGPHVGDLENLEAMNALDASVLALRQLLGVTPEVVAHDLHPGYHSTARAQCLPWPCVGVQHHHAHLAAVMGEHRLEGPALGLAWDGTGYGPDGTAWGGELLLVEYARFLRLATFRPLLLPGADRAIVEPWRLALAALEDAFPDGIELSRFPLFRALDERRVTLVRRMMSSGLQTPRAHGVGRWFDAVGALVLGLGESRYEGEVALRWNLAARDGESAVYPFRLDERADPAELDLRVMMRALVEELLCGVDAGTISARFHNTLCVAAVELLVRAAAGRGRLPVVLGGGCFQNRRLAEGIARRARSAGFSVYLPSRVPPGDGGLALGQALVADARIKEGTCA